MASVNLKNFLACLTVAFTVITPARAQAERSPKTVVATPASQGEGSGLRIIVSDLPLDAAKAAAGWEALTPTSKLRAFCDSSALVGLAANGQALTLADSEMTGRMLGCGTSRFLAGEGATVRVILVEKKSAATCGSTRDLPQLVLDERERDTLLAVQFKQVGKLLPGVTAAPGPEILCAWAWPDIHLTQNRAFLSIVASNDADPVQSASASVITGAPEHLFLSADAVVKGVDQLKYDTATRTLAHKESTDHLYLAVNYMAGDVYGKLPAFDMRRVVGKIAFQANKRPFDSVGIGVGYRFADIFSATNPSGLDSSGFVLYVGHYWTKPDADGAANAPSSARVNSTRIGLSYSIGTAIDWLKGKK